MSAITLTRREAEHLSEAAERFGTQPDGVVDAVHLRDNTRIGTTRFAEMRRAGLLEHVKHERGAMYRLTLAGWAAIEAALET